MNLPAKFWIVTFITFINSVCFTILIPTLYPYAKQLGLSDFQASLLTTAFAISQFIATPILGRLSDFLGRRPLLIISLFGTVLANLLASVSSTALFLFLARILDGLTGGNNSIARAVISDTIPAAERPKAFGFFDAAFRLGFVTGPAISFFAQSLPTFPGVTPLGMSFFVAAAIAFIATALTFFFLPETLLQRAKIQLGWQMLGLGKILQSARHPKLGRLFLLTFFSGCTFTIFTFAFQPFFLNVLQEDARSLAVMFTLIGVVGVITQIFAVAPLTKRFNLADILFGAIATRSFVFLMIPTFPTLTPFVLLFIILGVSSSFPMPLIASILSINTSDQEQGEVMGINSSYLSISNVIGPTIAGLLVSISYSTPFWVAGVLTVFTAGFALSLKSMLKCNRK